MFGAVKCTYGADPVMTRPENTTRTVMALAFLVFNLKKLLKTSSLLISRVLRRQFQTRLEEPKAFHWVFLRLYGVCRQAQTDCAGTRHRLLMAGQLWRAVTEQTLNSLAVV